MPHQAIQSLIGSAIIDREFCRRLLDPSTRDEALALFDLAPAEREFIRSIPHTETLAEFATVLDEWLSEQDHRNALPVEPRADWRFAGRFNVSAFER